MSSAFVTLWISASFIDVRDEFLLRLHGVTVSGLVLGTGVFPSGLVLGVQLLGALQALLLIESFSILLFLCALLGPGAFCCFLQRHIPHSLVCGDPPSVSWFEHPTEGYDSRDRSLWLFAAHVSSA